MGWLYNEKHHSAKLCLGKVSAALLLGSEGEWDSSANLLFILAPLVP